MKIKVSLDEILMENRKKRKGRKYRKRQQKLLRKLHCPKLINLRENILEDIRNKKHLLLRQLAEETEQRLSELLNNNERLIEVKPLKKVVYNNSISVLDTMFNDMNIEEKELV